MAALTIGGTTGISQPPNAASAAFRWLVNDLIGTAAAVQRPSKVPAGQSTASTIRAGWAPTRGCPTSTAPAPTVSRAIAGAP